jgi:lipopolysaccharide biosynthesis glycosyltransferase
MINIFIGYDPKEAVCYSVCSNSITRLSSIPITITPLNLANIPNYKETHTDGSTEFSYSRFLVPYLMGYAGWAIYMDCDMILQADILNLWQLRDSSKAIQCVKHDYKTKQSTKFLNQANHNYKRKNWSSMMLINCSHPSNQQLTPHLIESSTGEYLHQFNWVSDEDIGELPIEWNWLSDEYGANNNAKLIHYTLGSPCFEQYKNTPMANLWFEEMSYLKSNTDI